MNQPHSFDPDGRQAAWAERMGSRAIEFPEFRGESVAVASEVPERQAVVRSERDCGCNKCECPQGCDCSNKGGGLSQRRSEREQRVAVALAWGMESAYQGSSAYWRVAA